MGARIRYARIAADMTIVELARELRVSYGFMARVEQDRRKLPVYRWARLIAVLPSIKLEELADVVLEDDFLELDPRRLSPSARAEIAAFLVNEANGGAQPPAKKDAA